MYACNTISSRSRAFSAGRRAAFAGGFTLVEVLAVVVIMGIAAAIAIPFMGTRDDLRVTAAARNLVADLIYAQNTAITTGSAVYVRFDSTNNKYTLLSATNGVAPSYGTALKHPIRQDDYVTRFGPSTKGYENLVLDAGTKFSGSDSNYANEITIVFDEIGAPYVWDYTLNQRNDLASGQVVLKCGNFKQAVTVSPATGEISVGAMTVQ